jgi:hypothetical protein
MLRFVTFSNGRDKSKNISKRYVTGWSRDGHDKRSKTYGIL